MILIEQFTKFRAHNAKERKLKQDIEKKQAKLRKMECSRNSSWIKTLLEPLAKAIAAKEGYKHWCIMGPFGLGNETSIWFYNTPEQYKNCEVDSITFRPDLWNDDEEEGFNPFGLKVKDYSQNTGAFPENSIGARNGGNFPSIIPPANADLD